MEYKQYLKSKTWKRIREKAMIRAGYKCQLCNQGGKLNVHHRSYENLGREHASDLITLCEKCHTTFHKAAEVAKLHKLFNMFIKNRIEIEKILKKYDSIY